jgi:hypothetical protein
MAEQKYGKVSTEEWMPVHPKADWWPYLREHCPSFSFLNDGNKTLVRFGDAEEQSKFRRWVSSQGGSSPPA